MSKPPDAAAAAAPHRVVSREQLEWAIGILNRHKHRSSSAWWMHAKAIRAAIAEAQTQAAPPKPDAAALALVREGLVGAVPALQNACDCLFDFDSGTKYHDAGKTADDALERAREALAALDALSGGECQAPDLATRNSRALISRWRRRQTSSAQCADELERIFPDTRDPASRLLRGGDAPEPPAAEAGGGLEWREGEAPGGVLVRQARADTWALVAVGPWPNAAVVRWTVENADEELSGVGEAATGSDAKSAAETWLRSLAEGRIRDARAIGAALGEAGP